MLWCSNPIFLLNLYRRTKFKNVIVLLQFPDNYPSAAILLELKSKTLPPSLLSKLTELFDQEIKKFLEKKQVILILISGIGGHYTGFYQLKLM